ncbi:MAG: glycosyltransferase [Anaerolineales bacterium]|nr:glycosyltransferase [Anaerolineales bacterium]
MQPLISIITPSFQQAHYLEQTIRSVLNQDYPNLEYIVIDGGSTDGSVDVIRRYENHITRWVSEPDKGQTDALNKGFAMANGEILAWLNSDDLYYPGAVSAAAAYLQQHAEVGLVYGDADYIDEDGKVIGRFPAAHTDYNRLRRGYVHIPQQAAFFRAFLWKQVGPLDPSFYFAMDYDLWVRLASVAPIRYQPDLWAAFRLHKGAKSVSEADRCWPEMLRVHERRGGSRFSILYMKYLLRRLLEPWMPFRLKLRLGIQGLAMKLDRNRKVENH